MAKQEFKSDAGKATIVFDTDAGDVTVGGETADGTFTLKEAGGNPAVVLDVNDPAPGLTPGTTMTAFSRRLQRMITLNAESATVLVGVLAGSPSPGRLFVVGNENHIVHRMTGEDATLTVGGQDSSGEVKVVTTEPDPTITLSAKTREIVTRDSEDAISFHVDTETGSVSAKGNLVAAGSLFLSGDLILLDTVNKNRIVHLTNKGELLILNSNTTATLKHDGETAELSIGIPDGATGGDVKIFDNGGDEVIRLNGKTGEVHIRHRPDDDVGVTLPGFHRGVLFHEKFGDVLLGWIRDDLSAMSPEIEDLFAGILNTSRGNTAVKPAIEVFDDENRRGTQLRSGLLVLGDTATGKEVNGVLHVRNGEGRIIFEADAEKDQVRVDEETLTVIEGDMTVQGTLHTRTIIANTIMDSNGKVLVASPGGEPPTRLRVVELIADSVTAKKTLEAQGTLEVKDLRAVDIEVAGDLRLTGGDCAEEFEIAEGDPTGPGTVLVLSDEGRMRACGSAYDRKVAGVLSGAGGLSPSLTLSGEGGVNRSPVALNGKVYCKVDATFGAISVGDLLTTSPTSGHAMLATDPTRAFGAVIGKALRGMDAGRGLIPILVALQ